MYHIFATSKTFGPFPPRASIGQMWHQPGSLVLFWKPQSKSRLMMVAPVILTSIRKIMMSRMDLVGFWWSLWSWWYWWSWWSWWILMDLDWSWWILIILIILMSGWIKDQGSWWSWWSWWSRWSWWAAGSRIKDLYDLDDIDDLDYLDEHQDLDDLDEFDDLDDLDDLDEGLD